MTDEGITRIADTYHAWRGDDHVGAGLVPAQGDRGMECREGRPYQDVAGFCKAAKLEEIRQHGHVLTPGRYVGIEEAEDDGEPFEDKMARLTALWREQRAEAARLDAAIARNLERPGYGG